MIAKVLGPLRVTMNGESVAPTALKARKLFALLILNHGRVVQRATIERELWDADAPASATTGIQNSVMQIRKAIAGCRNGPSSGRAPKDVLVTEATGYRLDVCGDQFDMTCHRRLVTDADRATADGDFPLASALLNSALRLWRDVPLADLPTGPVLRAHAHRLTEDRRAAFGRRVALDIRLGRTSEVVGELRALATLHPHDELLHQYLILALHLSGRRGDSLAAYQDARTAIVYHTGLEPSPQLRDLQRCILSGAERLTPELELRLLGRPVPVSV
ncbi:BTAD domain-containing putative transcriptional regulator [Streptomyces sp. NPDC050145]|uniref:AfsR/SARP family transcriptional regulator n=1 Tax=Streptomyces sp. NPDC050145 TaxID=3365602 RepID=UPI0037912275